MSKVIRHLIALLALLAQTLTSAAALSAMPAGAGLTELVICGESGAEKIWLDANGAEVPGAPVAPAAHDCLNCLICCGFDSTLGADGAQVEVWAVTGAVPDGPAYAEPAVLSRPWLVARPRGPPCGKPLENILTFRLEFGQFWPGQAVALRGQPKKDARN